MDIAQAARYVRYALRSCTDLIRHSIVMRFTLRILTSIDQREGGTFQNVCQDFAYGSPYAERMEKHVNGALG